MKLRSLHICVLVEAVMIVGLVAVIVYLLCHPRSHNEVISGNLSAISRPHQASQVRSDRSQPTKVHKKRHRRHCHILQRVRKHHRLTGSLNESSQERAARHSDILDFLGFTNESANLRFTLQALSIVRSLTDQLKTAKIAACPPVPPTPICPVCSCNTEASLNDSDIIRTTDSPYSTAPVFTERTKLPETTLITTTVQDGAKSFSYPTPGAFIKNHLAGISEIRLSPTASVSVSTSMPIFTEPTLKPWESGIPDEKGTFKTQRECYLDKVGIPVFNSKDPLPGYELLIPRFHLFGSWFRDANPPDSDFAKRRWVLKNWYNSDLDEYPSTEDLYRRSGAVTFHINERISGTGSVVHGGFLYFHLWNTPYLMKFNLRTENLTLRAELPRLAYRDCDPDKPLPTGFQRCEPPAAEAYLYGQAHNFVDFAVDENGLWVVYHYSNESFLVVSKLDFNTLKPIATYELKSHDINAFSNSFIMCGVFYGIINTPAKHSHIDFVYSLHQNRPLSVGPFPWTNPFEGTTMVDYNPYDRQFYTYDKGRLLTVPVRVVHSVNDLSSFDRRYRSH